MMQLKQVLSRLLYEFNDKSPVRFDAKPPVGCSQGDVRFNMFHDSSINVKKRKITDKKDGGRKRRKKIKVKKNRGRKKVASDVIGCFCTSKVRSTMIFNSSFICCYFCTYYPILFTFPCIYLIFFM